MVRFLLIAVALVAVAYVAVTNAVFTVAPGEVAVVARDGKAVRVVPPGLSWRIPLIEEVAYINAGRVYRAPFEHTVSLADGSDCRVSSTVTLRVSDPARVYAWRVAQGLGGSNAAPPSDGTEFRAWESALASALAEAARRAAPESAQRTIESWLHRYGSATLEDGTNIVAVAPKAVTCRGS